jgi:hypothetical protein
LQAAYFEGDRYAPAILQTMDTDRNGSLTGAELSLDTPEKQAVVADRLAALGLLNPRIASEVQPYSVNHNVASGEWAVKTAIRHADSS